MTRETAKEMEPVADAAAGWVARLNTPRVSGSDLEGLRRWLDGGAGRREAFLQARRDWHTVRDALALREPAAATSAASRSVLKGARTSRQLTRRAFGVGALAASAAGVFWAGSRSSIHLWPSLDELGAEYRTATGERRTIDLPQSAQVEMNTRTSFSQVSASTLDLVSGEIAVIASSAIRVSAGHVWATAENASFTLWNEGGRVTVTCLSGETALVIGTRDASLSAHRQVVYENARLGAAATVDPDIVTAWRRGMLVFESTPLSEAISQINRYRRGRIVLAASQPRALALSATFRLDKIGDAVPKIAEAFHLKVTELPGSVSILS